MFKDFSIFSSGGHLVYRRGTILALLVGSHLGNIPVKFESHWPKGSGGEHLKQIVDDGHCVFTIAHHEHFVLR